MHSRGFVSGGLTVYCRKCKDIITQLLIKDDAQRLGSRTGASEVKQHKWFSKINWGLLRNTQPPVSRSPLSIIAFSSLRFFDCECWTGFLTAVVAH